MLIFLNCLMRIADSNQTSYCGVRFLISYLKDYIFMLPPRQSLVWILQEEKHCASIDGRTVIASIHQPSCDVFELFDRLYLLSGGKTVYFGKAFEANQFFAEAEFPCPSFRNPSDHFLRCCNATLRKLIKYNDDPLNKMTTTEVIRSLVDFYRHSQYCYVANETVEEMSKVKGTVLDSNGSQARLYL